MVNAESLTDVQKKIFETIPKGDVGELKTLLTQLQGTADFVDENGMTPLQHACYKGNTELVQTLLDQVSPKTKKKPLRCSVRFIETSSHTLRLCDRIWK